MLFWSRIFVENGPCKNISPFIHDNILHLFSKTPSVFKPIPHLIQLFFLFRPTMVQSVKACRMQDTNLPYFSLLSSTARASNDYMYLFHFD